MLCLSAHLHRVHGCPRSLPKTHVLHHEELPVLAIAFVTHRSKVGAFAPLRGLLWCPSSSPTAANSLRLEAPSLQAFSLTKPRPRPTSFQPCPPIRERWTRCPRATLER